MVKVIATAKISWNFDDADLSVMTTKEIRAKFTEGLEEKIKDSLEAAETNIETFEIRQEA